MATTWTMLVCGLGLNYLIDEQIPSLKIQRDSTLKLFMPFARSLAFQQLIQT